MMLLLNSKCIKDNQDKQYALTCLLHTESNTTKTSNFTHDKTISNSFLHVHDRARVSLKTICYICIYISRQYCAQGKKVTWRYFHRKTNTFNIQHIYLFCVYVWMYIFCTYKIVLSRTVLSHRFKIYKNTNCCIDWQCYSGTSSLILSAHWYL